MTTDHLSETARVDFRHNAEHGYGLDVRYPYSRLSEKNFGWGGAAGAYHAINLDMNCSLFYCQHVLNSLIQQIRKVIVTSLEVDLT